MRKDNPNYGPGSVSTIAKSRLNALQKETKRPPSLLNAITKANEGAKSPSSQNIQNRVATEKAMKREVGGRR